LAKFNRIKGTQDILPQESYNWQFIEDTIKDCMWSYNYKEIRTPVFEKTELFSRSIGQETDIVTKEMYTFLDRGKKSITLKPEMTAPAIRAYLENNLGEQLPLNKLYYISSLFRQENPQTGRLRQFNQFGAEAIGSDSPDLDSEIILLALEVYSKLGIKGLNLKINSVGDLTCREPFKQQLKSYLKPIISEYCSDCQQRFNLNVMRVLDCKKEHCRKLNNNAPKLIDNLCDECQSNFDTIKQDLTDSGIEYIINPYLVRGLDYYTNTVFEITSDNLGAQDAICGGGRYDLLCEELGGPATPAVGFASGIERLMLVMNAQNLLDKESRPLQIYISVLGSEASKEAQKWLFNLRRKGFRVDKDYLSRSLKAQMRDANRQKAQIVLMLGDNELNKKKFSVKEMESGNQLNIKFEDITIYLSKYFKSDSK
jgi:histidyl-tRNA synthetase